MKTVLKQLVYQIFENFCCENNLDIKLSFAMPKGYENAYGTFDNNTLFLNFDLLQDKTNLVFNLFHELRHAFQYKHPENLIYFSKKALSMLFYMTGLVLNYLTKSGKFAISKTPKSIC